MFEKTVSALCYTICRQYEALSYHAPYNDVVEFVLARYHAMPKYLRFPVKGTTLVFTFGTLALRLKGHVFYHLDQDARLSWVERWRRSPVGPLRDLIRFYESLATFALFGRQK